MKFAMLSLGSGTSKTILQAANDYFDEVEDLNLKKIEVHLSSKCSEVLYKGERLKDFDSIYLRGSFKYSLLLTSIAECLNNQCYLPVSSKSFTVSNDKFLNQLELGKNNVPIPKTYLASSVGAAKKVLEKINYPIVMKLPMGTHGKGVIFADSYPSAISFLDTLDVFNQPFIIQDYVETEGKDIRALVLGNKVVASMQREAVKGEKRSNIHQGGEGSYIELDNYTKKISVKAAKAVEADICAVDILNSIKGPQVIETNLSPGLQGLSRAVKRDLGEDIAKFLYKKTKEFKENIKRIKSQKIMSELGVETNNATRNIISNLNFRGEKILLPEFVTKLSKFNYNEEVNFSIEKGKVVIKKY